MELLSKENIVIERSYFGENGKENDLVKGRVEQVRTTIKYGDKLIYSEFSDFKKLKNSTKPIIDFLTFEKPKEIDFQKIAEDENVIIYFARQDVQSKALRPIDMYVPEADRERLTDQMIATAYDIADVIKGL